MRKVFAVFLMMVVAACGKEKAKSTDTSATAETDKTGGKPAKPLDPSLRRQPAVRRHLAPITVDEVKELLPAVEGARVLKPLAKAQQGERVEIVMCFDSGETVDIAEKVKSTLAHAGWANVNNRVHPTLKDRVGLNGQKPPYMLVGTIQRGSWPDCIGDKGQTHVTLGTHKVETTRIEGAAPVGPRPGVVGPVGPGAMRPDLIPRPVLPPQPAPTPAPTPAPAPPATP